MTVRVGLGGVTGRMGQEIFAASLDRDDIEVVGGVLHVRQPGSGQSLRGVQSAGDLLPMIDVFVDFSVAAASGPYANACADAGIPYLSGVTGLTDEQLNGLCRAAERVPVFYGRNTSLGIALLTQLVRTAAAVLPDFDVEVVEMHHSDKRDAPSGTALALVESVEESRSGSQERRLGRFGEMPRQSGEIGIHALRGGGNPGEHTVILASGGEELRLSHRALSRRTFADGALDVATWLIRQPVGFYEMQDVLYDRLGIGATA